MSVTTIAYKDGNNASKTANAGSDGTNTTTGVTLFDSSAAYISTLPVSIASSNVVITGGTTFVASGSLTRPANTTQYAIGDGIVDTSTNPLSFATATRVSAGSGVVLGARLICNSAVTTNALFRLWLFNATPGTLTDNNAFNVTYAQRASRIGYFDFLSPVVGSDCLDFTGLAGQVNPMAFDLASGTTMYGMLTALAAYTPTSGELMEVDIQILQD